MSHEKIVEITNDNFESEVLASDKPVLVDFWAEWCGPCRMVAPTLDRIAESKDDVKIAKLNVDDEQALAMKYGVQSIPTFILFKNGEATDRMMGAMPLNAFEEFLRRNA